MIKKIYVIAGAPHSRKSTTIRALTGAYQLSRFELAFAEGNERALILTTSPNEVESTEFPIGINPNQLIDMIKNESEIDCVILTLRSVNALHNLPLANGYILALLHAGFEIATVVMYNTEIEIPSGVEAVLIQNTADTPSNALANEIRQIWSLI